METNPTSLNVLRRHALPEVLFAPDIALALDLPETVAEEAARMGRFGREFYVHGRVAVLRADFLEALAARGDEDDERGKELLGTRLQAVDQHEGVES